MSIVERVAGGIGWFVSHETFLEEAYSPLDLKPLSGLFDVRTPFRMDAEAAKAASGIQDEDRTKKKKKRRVECDIFLHEKKRCQDFLDALNHKFEPPPSPDTIRENNRSVRELVKRLHNDDDINLPSSVRTNSSSSGAFEIVNGRRYAIPARSEFHVGDAADCLGRMVSAGRQEFKDESDC